MSIDFGRAQFGHFMVHM